MPGRDGTGPTGGVASGRGSGNCHGAKAVRCTTGLGQGLGSKRCLKNSATVPTSSKTQKELLQEHKELLENKLDIINKQLQSL